MSSQVARWVQRGFGSSFGDLGKAVPQHLHAVVAHQGVEDVGEIHHVIDRQDVEPHADAECLLAPTMAEQPHRRRQRKDEIG